MVVIAIITLPKMFKGYQQSLDLSLEAAYFYVILPPCLFNLFLGSGEYTIFLCLFYLWQEAFSRLGQRHQPLQKFETYKPAGFRKITLWIILLLIASTASALVPQDSENFNFIGTFGFAVPYGLSLIFFEQAILCRRKVAVCLLLALQLIPVVIYVVFFWSGFGRLVIGSYAFMPLLIVNSRYDIGLRARHLALLAPGALAAAFLSRFKGSDFSRMTDDSGNSHLELTQEMLLSMHQRITPEFSEYFRQWSLMLLQWVPRDFWPSKPLGLGLSFVKDWWGDIGFAEGHSIAIGFLGEQFWYLNRLALAGLCFYLMTLVFIRRAITKYSGNSAAPLAAFDAFLPVYIWGGGASFGARIWFFVIPMIAALHILGARRADLQAGNVSQGWR